MNWFWFVGTVLVWIVAIFAVMPWFANIFEHYAEWVDRRFK